MAGYKFAILRWPKAAIIIGAGDYREGWFLIDDDTIELNDSIGWEPLIQEVDQAWFEKATDRLTPETPGFP